MKENVKCLIKKEKKTRKKTKFFVRNVDKLFHVNKNLQDIWQMFTTIYKQTIDTAVIIHIIDSNKRGKLKCFVFI